MKSIRKILFGVLLLAVGGTTYAQISTNTPYSRYGLGDLSDHSFAGNAAMGGTGIGYRTPFHINPMNPASYSAVDSLSFMFDMGVSLKQSQFKESGLRINANNSSFDYLAAQFRLHRRVGLSLGMLPVSTVGYKFSTTTNVADADVKAYNTMSGSGGLQKAYIGIGAKLFPQLSIGANVAYLYGTIDHSNTLTLSNGGDQTAETHTLKVNSYTLDFGLQYTQKIGKTDFLTIGATYALGHNLGSEDKQVVSLTDGSTYKKTTEAIVKDGYSLPHSYGVGISYAHGNRWLFNADYAVQQWKNAIYINKDNAYLNRTRIALGAELLPAANSRKYFARVRYRVGAFYTTPYVTTPAGDAPKEYGVSAGIGLPLSTYQRNSVLNITGQFVRATAANSMLMSENRFVIKVGLTFNERWFMKWKIQ